MCAERMRPEHIYTAADIRSRLNRISGVRRGDFFVPPLREQDREQAKRRPERHVLGKAPARRARRSSYNPDIGYFTLQGRPLGEVLQAEGAPGGGRGWRG